MLRQYVTNQATRIIVKAAGELSADKAQEISDDDDVQITGTDDVEELDKQALQARDQAQDSVVAVDVERYIPRITEDRQWVISELDLGKTPVRFSNGSYLGQQFFRVDSRRMRSVGHRRRRFSLSSLLSSSSDATRGSLHKGSLKASLPMDKSLLSRRLLILKTFTPMLFL